MATIVIKKIGSQVGDDYSTLTAWVADRITSKNLVTLDTIEIAEVRGETFTTTAVNIANFTNTTTTDATHYIEIRPMSTATWFKGDFGNLTGVPVFTSTGMAFTSGLISCYIDNVFIKGIVIKDLVTPASASLYAFDFSCLTAHKSQIINCGIMHLKTTSASGAITVCGFYNGGYADFINCFSNDLYAKSTISNKAVNCWAFDGDYQLVNKGHCYNCVSINNTSEEASPGTNGDCLVYGFVNLTDCKNCIGGLNTKVSPATGLIDAFRGLTITNQSNNLSDDATATGLTNKAISNQILNVSLANADCHLKAGADAIQAGTDLSASFLRDINGRLRVAPWDIGADGSLRMKELVKSGTTIKSGTSLK